MPKDIDMSQAPRCASHLGVKLCGVHHTEESSALNFYKKKTLWCDAHHRVKLLDVHPTSESKCTLQSQNHNLCKSLVAFNGTIRINPFRGERTYSISTEKISRKKLDLQNLILTTQCY